MKDETMVILTGKQYIDIKNNLLTNDTCELNLGSANKPHVVKVSAIYLDTDPDFTRNPSQFAKIDDKKNVQVRIEYEE